MSTPALMKISPQGQIRIPKKIMTTLGIENGDYVEVEIEKGQVVLKPRKIIDPAQGWYWTKEWQEREGHIDVEIRKKNISPEFKTVEQGLKWLKK